MQEKRRDKEADWEGTKLKFTHYKFVEEALYRNEAVSKLLTEIRHWGSGQLSGDNKMTDLHKHIHGVTAM